MRVYAGIDEAGYGPMFGPLVIGRSVLAVDGGDPEAEADFWKLLGKAVCKARGDKRGRVAVNDSKKLHTSSAKHRLRDLERGVLSFATLAGHRPGNVGDLLDALGETAHRRMRDLPWYAPTPTWPWQDLPVDSTAGEIAVATGMLTAAAKVAGVTVLDVGAAIVFEDQFNQMVHATRSKATVAFTFVSRHLAAIWQRYGAHDPVVVVDRQSGRTHYRQPLALAIPDANMQVIDESELASVYRLSTDRPTPRSMTIRFEIDSEQNHLPVALASMISKFSRELLMMRFQKWFSERAADIKPTAGYGTDAKRFWLDVQPHLAEWNIAPDQLRRRR